MANDNPFHVGSGELTFEIIADLLASGRKLALTEDVKKRIQKCRDYLDNKMASQKEPIYGVTTGFGSLCNRTISTEQLTALQENLVKSHACSVGAEVQPEIVRLMLFLKAHALSLGYSGVQVETVQRIIDLYNNDIRHTAGGLRPGLVRGFGRPRAIGQPFPAADRGGRGIL